MHTALDAGKLEANALYLASLLDVEFIEEIEAFMRLIDGGDAGIGIVFGYRPSPAIHRLIIDERQEYNVEGKVSPGVALVKLDSDRELSIDARLDVASVHGPWNFRSVVGTSPLG